jgi:glyceraldehyde 3-phosphate dehydrogenase
MTKKVAINGFGRIGRNAFKIALNRDDLEIVAINDLVDASTLAHLLKYDSTYGTYDKEVSSDDENIIVDGQKFRVFSEKDPANLPWKDLGIDVVIESTGLFTDAEKARAHINAGAQKIVVSAAVKGDSTMIVLGVNDDKLENVGEVISNASCTTNCIAPVMAILENHFGVAKAMMTTAHSYTQDQRLLDSPHKDPRRMRSAAANIVPTSTNASVAATEVIPELKGKFAGLSLRVPTPVVSIADITAVLKRPTTRDEINQVLSDAAKQPYYQGILDVTNEELVSSDFIGNACSSIVDLNLTDVVDGDLVKVVAWYDNEWGYSNRLVELTADVAKAVE